MEAESTQRQNPILEMTVRRACPGCDDPGYDAEGKYVGDICPHCGSARKPQEVLPPVEIRRL